jgi:hypothetical protein
MAVLAGALMGSLVTLLVQSPDTTGAAAQPLRVTDAPTCPAVPSQSTPTAVKTKPTPAATVAGAPAWVARPASDAQILTQSGVVLPVTSVVHSGDALIISVMLTAACPGDVSATDSRGNEYRTIGDVTDTLRHRTMIIAALDVNPLTTADTITLTYPRSSKYHVAVDEFQGITTAVSHATAFGESGGTAFTTGPAAAPCRTGDLTVAAVGTNTGTAPTFTPDWTALPVLKLSSYRLSTAYQTASTTAPCAVNGTTTAQWGAVMAVFR